MARHKSEVEGHMLLKFRGGGVVVWGGHRLRDLPDPSLPSSRRTEGDASQQELNSRSSQKPDTSVFAAAHAKTDISTATSFGRPNYSSERILKRSLGQSLRQSDSQPHVQSLLESLPQAGQRSEKFTQNSSRKTLKERNLGYVRKDGRK